MATEARSIPGRAQDIPGITNISETPGGTIWGTTPGGSRIQYDRSMLMKLAMSPLSKSPPTNLANIPGVSGPDRHHTIAEEAGDDEDDTMDVAKPAVASPEPPANNGPDNDDVFAME